MSSIDPLAAGRAEATATVGARATPPAVREGLRLIREGGFVLRVDRATLAEWVAVITVSIGALAIWLYAVLTSNLAGYTDIGLVSVLPVWSYAAFLPIALAFASVVSARRPSTWLLTIICLVLILMLYGAVPWAEGQPRFSPSWRHLGLIDYVARNGSVNPAIDAYHNWPGMFILASALTEAVGQLDATTLALWAPVWLNVLYLPALYVLLDSLTEDRRVVWLAIWLFYLTDWIGQDYFSPQGFAMFFFLVSAALIVRWFSARDPRPGRAPLAEPARPAVRRLLRPVQIVRERILTGEPIRALELSPARRSGLMAMFLVIFGFVVTGHQLTPFFTVAVVGTLVLLLRFPWPSLPVALGVMIAAWVAFAAVAFLIGHFQNVAGYVGTLSDSLAANLTGRLQGSDGHKAVVFLRLGFAVAVWGLALVGVLRRIRAGRLDVITAALAAAPFPLFAVQAYGGEMLLRIYLFSLPFMALLIAFAFIPRRQIEAGRMVTLSIVVATVALVGPFLVARYGNERIESFTAGEVAAVNQLYAIAPPDSMLVGIVGNVPWKNLRYEEYRFRPAGDDTYYRDLDGLYEAMINHNGPVFLLITRTQQAYAEMIIGAAPAEWTAFQAELFGTGWFQVLSRTPDATIARFIPPVTATP